MKNLMIHIGAGRPGVNFENDALMRIQIDNSIDFGWNREDILIYTDFLFEHNGVRSIETPANIGYDFDRRANKIAVVSWLLERGLLPNDLYWCHDFDAFQVAPFTEDDLELGTADMALVHYHYKDEWALSNFFFKPSAFDIIQRIHHSTLVNNFETRNNEKVLTSLINNGSIPKDRFNKLDVSFNITKRCLRTVYREAQKPIKVLHFRPSDKDELMRCTALDMFMYGNNGMRKPLVDDRLKKIFNKYGIA